MKIRSDIIVTEVAGEFLAVPTGKMAESRVIMRLNETGYFIWRAIESCKSTNEIASALTNEYDVDIDTAVEKLKSFTERLREVGALEE